MMQNIACSAPECTNAVIGQCAGYGTPCGRFYCANHSKDGLCEECAEKKKQADLIKEENELLQHIFDDYVQAAERIPRMGCGNWIGALVVMLIVVLVFSAVDIGFVTGIGVVLAWVGFFAYSSKIAKRRMRKIEQSEETRPGFREFYEKWEHERNKAEFKSAVLVSLAASTSAVDAYQNAKYGATMDDIRSIAQNTENIVRKLK